MKPLDELIGLPDVEAIRAFMEQNIDIDESHPVIARLFADWLRTVDTRRALIETMLPVFVAAMRAHLAMLQPGRPFNAEDGVEPLVMMSRAAEVAFVELDADTLKALGVTSK